MADNTVKKNSNYAPFVDTEADAGEADIYPGNFLELDGSGDVIKRDSEASLDTQAVGRGFMADVSRSDPDLGKTDAYPNGERVSAVYVPVGGTVDARLAAGSDLGTAADANVSENDILEEADVGGLKKHTGTATTGDGTGAATETVYDRGALYMALEAVDNSGAAAGVSNQKYIQVVRIA